MTRTPNFGLWFADANLETSGMNANCFPENLLQNKTTSLESFLFVACSISLSCVFTVLSRELVSCCFCRDALRWFSYGFAVIVSQYTLYTRCIQERWMHECISEPTRRDDGMHARNVLSEPDGCQHRQLCKPHHLRRQRRHQNARCKLRDPSHSSGRTRT